MSRIFITTSKHPELKEGVGLQTKAPHSGSAWFTPNGVSFFKETIEMHHIKGYIKEVQKPEFTKAAMIEFARWYSNHDFDVSGIEIVDLWIEDC